jgi:hypothetical protein
VNAAALSCVRTLLLLLLLLASCCPSDAKVQRLRDEAERDNPGRVARGIQTALAKRGLEDLGPLAEVAPDEGATIGEPAIDREGRVVIVLQPEGGSCSQLSPEPPRAARGQDGRISVVVVHAVEKVRRVHQCGSCTVGCGTGNRLPSPATYVVPVATRAELGPAIEIEVEEVVVYRSCDHEKLAP